MATKNDSQFLTFIPRKQSRREMVRTLEEHTDIALLEFQSPTAALIAEPIPRSARYTGWIITTMVLSAILMLALFKVERVVTAPGRVTTAVPDIVIQPLETAIVREVFAHVGQRVQKDQLLATLDPTFAGTDDKSTAAQAASLAAEVARLRSELAGKMYLSDGTSYGDMQAMMFQQRRAQFQSHADSLREKIESVRVKVAQAKSALEFANSRLVGLRQVEEMRNQLERAQVGSRLNTLAARDSRMQMEAQAADAQKTMEGAAKDYQGAVADLADYVHQWQTETSQTLSQQERLLSDMVSQSAKAQFRHDLVQLRAPQAGVVLNVSAVTAGTIMQSGQELIRLTPSDAPMSIDASISGNTSGYVHIGDTVTIKFDTYPYMQYGYALGRVDVLSPDSFTSQSQDPHALPTSPDTGSTTSPSISTTSPVFYKAKISITELHVRNVPHDFKVVPGMPVVADISVGNRTILAALFSRIAPLAAEGMREP